MSPGEQRTILIMGLPGVGKTTLILKLERYCRERRFNVAGIITREVRENDERIGFRLRDISSGREGWLARKNGGGGPRVGRYSVVIYDLEGIGVRALEEAASGGSDITLVDEIGPMEMASQNFRRVVSTLLASGRALVATVRLGLHYKELEAIGTRAGVMKIILTRVNRETAFERVASTLENWLKDP